MSDQNKSIRKLPAFQNEAVYVVDDDDSVRTSLCFMLATLGLKKCSPFARRDDFLSAAPELSPGCIILDVNMNGTPLAAFQSGLKTLNRRWRVLLMSGSHERETVEAAIVGGALAFIEKPFSEEDLLKALEGCFASLQ